MLSVFLINNARRNLPPRIGQLTSNVERELCPDQSSLVKYVFSTTFEKMFSKLFSTNVLEQMMKSIDSDLESFYKEEDL
jgi:predicted  nucleic acid-binding Zn ribbon protein